MSVIKVTSDCTERMLTPNERERFRKNQRILADIIELGYGLDTHLVSCDCISERHQKGIMMKGSEIEQNKALLDIIQRRSYDDFSKFIVCLCDDRIKQRHVAAILLGKSFNYLHFA